MAITSTPFSAKAFKIEKLINGITYSSVRAMSSRCLLPSNYSLLS
jgi:hypothetical protein